MTADEIETIARAAAKAKRVYDRLQPDAVPDECWAEIEALWDLLEEERR